MKIVLIVVGLFATVAVVAGVVLVGTSGGFIGMSSEPQGTEVRTEIAGQRPLVETVSAPGEIEPLTKVEMSAEVSARIEQLPVREGDLVKKGDMVVKLDDRDLRAGLQSVRAQREAEKFRLRSEQASRAGLLKHLEFARRTLERQAALYESGDISRSTLDEAQDRVDDLEASVESTTHAISVIEASLAAADANIDRAEDALTKTVMKSPIDGIVTQLNAEVGEVVLVGTMNNPGTVIMTIADLSRMILNARVAETDVARVQEGQSSRIHINAYHDEVFGGVVRTVALQRTTNPDNTGFFETEVELDLQGRRIYSGLVANVDIEIDKHAGLSVESQAIVERLVDDLPKDIRDHPLVDKRKRVTAVVYRMVDGKAVCTPVHTGPSDLTHTLVTDGLDEGDEVVVGPFKVLESIKHDEAIRREGESGEDNGDGEGDEKDENTDEGGGENDGGDEPGADGEPAETGSESGQATTGSTE